MKLCVTGIVLFAVSMFGNPRDRSTCHRFPGWIGSECSCYYGLHLFYFIPVGEPGLCRLIYIVCRSSNRSIIYFFILLIIPNHFSIYIKSNILRVRLKQSPTNIYFFRTLGKCNYSPVNKFTCMFLLSTSVEKRI